MNSSPDDIVRFEARTGLDKQDIDVLTRLPLFAGLTDSELRHLLAGASIRRYAAKTVLFLHDEPATRFYVVFDGWVKLFRETVDGHESVIAVFRRGESFAEAAMFAQGVFPVSSMVVEDARLLVVPQDAFLARIRENSTLALNMLASMSSHLRHLVGHIEQLTVKSAAQRLATFLVGLSSSQSGQVELHLPFDKGLVAARLGMQPETLSRAIKKLGDMGVQTKGSIVQVPDMAGLRDFSEGDS